MIKSLIIGALFASSIFSQDLQQKKPKSPHLKTHTATKDYWNGLSAHDLFDQFGEDWAGGSTLDDGSHNPNEIKGWGSASATAWTQSKPSQSEMAANDQPQGGGQMMQPPGGQQQQQAPMQQPGGYSGGYQAGGFGYSSGGYGYSSGTGYQQQPSYGYSSGGYGYSSGTGYSSGGYGYSSGTGYDQSGYSTGYDQSGYSSAGFGGSTGYGYSSGTTGQLPGGQPMSQAPGNVGGMGATKGSGMMGAPGQGSGMMAGGAAGMMPGGKGAGAAFGAQGSVNGKCPLPHRHRKPWALLTIEQKDMFIDGFQQIRKNGKLDVIAQTHAQHDIQNYVHYTSLFSFYHSYMVWEVESAIRDLGGKFACFTMPYYDWTLDAGKEDDPSILHSGIGGDGDRENGLCVADDETGFSWQTCSDYSAWRTIDSTDGDGDGDDDDDDEDTKAWDGSYSGYDDNMDNDDNSDNDYGDGGISYSGYDDGDVFKAQYISYGDAYEEFDPEEHSDDPDWEPRDPNEANPDDLDDDELTDEALLESESVEEQCFWTQANCRANENSPFCCLKRKKSSTVLLPTAAEIGDAMYRSKNIKEWQGYLNEWYNKVQALFGADYYAHMANGYATEDPIFWLTQSFLTHLFSLWQDCWNYNNIPKDKLDMHYNSYHPYCGTFDAQPENCPAYNLALDAPMNFYELQKTDWSMVSHKIVTVRKMWTPDFWNVVYELGPFYAQSGVNNWCDNTRDSEWFIETMDYDVDEVHTEINTYSQNLREQMINDGVEQSGIFKTVSSLTCQYNRKYSKQSCWTPELEEMEEKETCDSEEIDVSALTNQTLDDFLAFEGVESNQCLKRIRREAFAYSEHALQVKKQLCKGDWDYKCPEYNELLYGQYASTLDNPVSKNFKKHTSFFAKSGWIWMIVINGILVIIVAIGCGIWHCSRSKTVSIPLSDDDDQLNEDENQVGTIQTSEVEEYQPLLV